MSQSKLGPLTCSYILFIKICGYLCAVHCSSGECVSSMHKKLPEEEDRVSWFPAERSLSPNG